MAPQPSYSFIAIALLLAVASASATDQTQGMTLLHAVLFLIHTRAHKQGYVFSFSFFCH
jgi:hypothetical protein